MKYDDHDESLIILSSFRVCLKKERKKQCIDNNHYKVSSSVQHDIYNDYYYYICKLRNSKTMMTFDDILYSFFDQQ